jgi:hypothetical protein
MTTRKKILTNGAAAAVCLAVIGYMYAQLIGMWAGSQMIPRTGTVMTSDLAVKAMGNFESATSNMLWRLPVCMAALGFGFVAIGEAMLTFWRAPTAEPVQSLAADLPPGFVVQETENMMRETMDQETLQVPGPRPMQLDEIGVSVFEVNESLSQLDELSIR